MKRREKTSEENLMKTERRSRDRRGPEGAAEGVTEGVRSVAYLPFKHHYHRHPRTTPDSRIAKNPSFSTTRRQSYG